MIAKQDILDRVREWHLRPDVIDNDYVLGWLLAALSAHPEAGARWVFKGARACGDTKPASETAAPEGAATPSASRRRQRPPHSAPTRSTHRPVIPQVDVSRHSCDCSFHMRTCPGRLRT